jgi:hypothetical protein
MSSPVLPILIPKEFPSFIDVDVLKKYVEQDVMANKEFFEDCGSTYKISSKEKAEWIIKKSIIGSKWVGKGNYCVDVNLDDGNIAIDVAVLTLHNSFTNEKSIIQCFGKSDLDGLFVKMEGENMINFFRDKLAQKFEKCEAKTIYYLLFVCNEKMISLVCLELRKELIRGMEFGSFTKKMKSVNVLNFIEEQYGKVKLYKSKKRVELRLSHTVIQPFCSRRVF